MERVLWYVLPINPEPWAVGAVSGKRISPNPNLVAFQSAVREQLKDERVVKVEGPIRLRFFFWRQTAKYLDAADRRRQRNAADATNLQKGLEDALQGLLFENDRSVVDIRSAIIEQGPKVKPCIAMAVSVVSESMMHVALDEVPAEVLSKVLESDQWEPKNDWGDSELPF